MRRVWPLRLIQFAPVVLLAIGLALWFSVPSPSRMWALTPQPAPSTLHDVPVVSTPDPTAEAMKAIIVERSAKSSTGEQSLDQGDLAQDMWFSAAQLVANRSAIAEPEGGFKPEAYSPNDAVFAAVTDYEKQTRSRIAVAIVPGAKDPRVVMSSIDDAGVLNAAERAELSSRGTLETLRRAVRGGLVPTPEGPGDSPTAAPLPISVPDTSFNGNTVGKRTVGFGTLALGGRIYEIYSVAPLNRSGTADTPFDIQQWTELATPQHQRALDVSATRQKGALFVIGPVDATPVLERVPAGMTAESATRFIALSRASTAAGFYQGAPYRLSAAMARAGGDGAVWGDSALESPGPPSASGTSPVPAVYFASASAVSPLRAVYAKQLGHRPIDLVRVWLGGNLQPLLGALVVLFALSLIASPAAFAFERRRLEQLDIQRERERVQRETRERVLERLTDLSRRMDTAAEEAASGERATIGQLAGEIDETVGELKRILEDAPLAGGERDE